MVVLAVCSHEGEGMRVLGKKITATIRFDHQNIPLWFFINNSCSGGNGSRRGRILSGLGFVEMAY